MKKILTACPHCLKTLGEDYRQFGFAPRCSTRRCSCRGLGRATGAVRLRPERRRAARPVLPGAIRRATWTSRATCCARRRGRQGAGALAPQPVLLRRRRRAAVRGARRGDAHQPAAIRAAAGDRAPATIVTACPFCAIMLKGAQASANATTEVVDLMTFVDGRMKSASAGARHAAAQAGRRSSQGRERSRLAGVAPQAPRGRGHRRASATRLIAAARADASAGARRAPSISQSVVGVGPPADPRAVARSHPAGDHLLPRPRRGRDHQPEFRRGVDRAHHAAVRLSRRRAGRPRAAAGARCCSSARDMAEGRPAAFTVDGPRGPAYQAQPGAVWLAKATGNPSCRFTSSRLRAGRCGAGTARRCRSRGAASRW